MPAARAARALTPTATKRRPVAVQRTADLDEDDADQREQRELRNAEQPADRETRRAPKATASVEVPLVR